MDSGDEKQEAEEDGSDLRQGGWNKHGCDGDVAKRQSPEDPEHREWRRLERVRDMRGKDSEERRRNRELRSSRREHSAGHEQDAGRRRHKDKKSKVEKTQVTIQEPMSGMSPETPEKDEDKMIQLLDEDSMKARVEF